MFGDTKEVSRRHKYKKDWYYDGQKKKDKRTNNDLQNTTQKKNEQHEPHWKPGVNRKG